MPELLEPGDDHLRELGYEHRDIAIPVLIKWLIGLFVFVGVSSGIALFLYVSFVPYRPATIAPAPTQAVSEEAPPQPRIQADPVQDMITFRAAEEKVLRGYAWTDKAKGRVRIPVESAIQKMAEQLPVESGSGLH